MHGPSSQSTLKRYVNNIHVHYMTQKCADEFDMKGTNSRYQHDAFFDTWCYEESVFKKWMYDIKPNHYKL